MTFCSCWTEWSLYKSKFFCNIVNKTVIRIEIPMTVFVTVSGNVLPIIVISYLKLDPLLIEKEFHFSLLLTWLGYFVKKTK
jgi:hypothetical protein